MFGLMRKMRLRRMLGQMAQARSTGRFGLRGFAGRAGLARGMRPRGLGRGRGLTGGRGLARGRGLRRFQARLQGLGAPRQSRQRARFSRRLR